MIGDRVRDRGSGISAGARARCDRMEALSSTLSTKPVARSRDHRSRAHVAGTCTYANVATYSRSSGPNHGGVAGLSRCRADAPRSKVAGIVDVAARVAEHPLQQRLRPGRHAERRERRERGRGGTRRSSAPSPNGRITMTPSPRSAASGRISRFDLALERVVGDLNRGDRARLHDLSQLAERGRLVMRRADGADTPPPCSSSSKRELLTPGHQVVDLIQVDAVVVEPSARRGLLRPSSAVVVQTLVATSAASLRARERGAQDALGLAVHRRGIEEVDAQAQRRRRRRPRACASAGAPLTSKVCQVPIPTTGTSSPDAPSVRRSIALYLFPAKAGSYARPHVARDPYRLRSITTTSECSWTRSRTISRPSAETSKSAHGEVGRQVGQLALRAGLEIDQPEILVPDVPRAGRPGAGRPRKKRRRLAPRVSESLGMV